MLTKFENLNHCVLDLTKVSAVYKTEKQKTFTIVVDGVEIAGVPEVAAREIVEQVNKLRTVPIDVVPMNPAFEK